MRDLIKAYLKGSVIFRTGNLKKVNNLEELWNISHSEHLFELIQITWSNEINWRILLEIANEVINEKLEEEGTR